MEPPRSAGPGHDLLPIVLLVIIAALILAAYWLFPVFQHYISNQDCVASGHTNC